MRCLIEMIQLIVNPYDSCIYINPYKIFLFFCDLVEPASPGAPTCSTKWCRDLDNMDASHAEMVPGSNC